MRTPVHFRSAIGELVTLRELRGDEPTRRLEGTLTDVTDSSLTLDEQELGPVTVALDAIERARTVFVWGATKPVKATPNKTSNKTKSKTTTKGARTPSTSKRKANHG